MKSPNLTILFVCFLSACTNVPEKKQNDVLILLTPEHPVSSGLTDANSTQSQLLDNDGNLYITYWDVSKDSAEEFKETEKSCENSLRDDMIFITATSIHDFNATNIRPSLYIPYVKCLLDNNYKLVDKEGFSPESYTLSFYRSHTTTYDYMPVGAMYSIVKKGARYISVYNDLLACEKSILDQGGGADESSTSYTKSVSIEKYVADFEECMTKKSYTIKNFYQSTDKTEY